VSLLTDIALPIARHFVTQQMVIDFAKQMIDDYAANLHAQTVALKASRKGPMPPAPVLHADYATKFASCQVLASRMDEAKEAAERILNLKPLYDKVLGVPWWFIGVLHYREANLAITAYLGNGQPLNRVTTATPKGRGPFLGPNAFVDGCVDALKMLKYDQVRDWSIGNALYLAEEFNGEGYHLRGLPSPYVWGGTSVQVPGKYDVDGHFVPTLWDKQLGVAAILKGVYRFGVNV
jgi:lysozyme family protein